MTARTTTWWAIPTRRSAAGPRCGRTIRPPASERHVETRLSPRQPRQALVDAALRLIEEKGPTGFTLSEAAKNAGVTPAAVYRHFEGREDLIAECARQGHEIFADLMEFAFNDGKPSALAAFEATGRAYLAFARKYPGHYMAMFESGTSANATPELALAAAKSRKVLEGGRGPVGAYPARKAPAADDVLRPYLGDEPRGGGAVRARPARGQHAVPARGPAGGGDRDLPPRSGPDPPDD
jgi:AcrR family transcriptional regulator